jgi:hypothetical protein
MLIAVQHLKHLISFALVFRVPKRHSRFGGVHIFKNGALASAKDSFSVSHPPFLQNGALAPTACTFCLFMTCGLLFDQFHLETLERNMSTPLKDFDHF